MRSYSKWWAFLIVIGSMSPGSAAQSSDVRPDALRRTIAEPSAEAARGLRTPDEYARAIFSWQDLPDWIFTDVTFGVRDGNLVFAKYRVSTPQDVVNYHDESEQVDWLIVDTGVLPSPVTLGLPDGRRVKVTSFSFSMDAEGRAVIDSLAGFDASGKPFSGSAGAPKSLPPCGGVFITGTCNDTFCSYFPISCVPNYGGADPCDCTGQPFGFCLNGTAMIVCAQSTCLGVCVYDPDISLTLCVCTGCTTWTPPAVYCTAKLNSLGCLPEISSTGLPSVSSQTGFDIRTSPLLPNKFGLFFYSTAGPLAAPFQGGWLCTKPPNRRLPVLNSGAAGPPPCPGTLSYDFNTWIASGVDPMLVADATVYLQTWSRDPADPFTTSLSNALRFTICP